MGAILNGLSLSKVRPYGSGFLIFSDYGRNPLRLAAIMEIPVIYVFTHDSIGVGEDGPTHQPIEHLASLRAIPGLITLRPADANEVVEAWKVIMQRRHEPVGLILTRQAVPTLDRTKYASAEGLRRGAYVLADAPDGKPDVLLLATGSEVALCVEAYEQLTAEGVKARVVSMPSWEMFEHHCREHPEYRESVLPVGGDGPRVGGAGVDVRLGAVRRRRAAGCVGMKTFGASAPLKELQKKFGFTGRRASWPPPRRLHRAGGIGNDHRRARPGAGAGRRRDRPGLGPRGAGLRPALWGSACAAGKLRVRGVPPRKRPRRWRGRSASRW